jgi:hypothetical protein
VAALVKAERRKPRRPPHPPCGAKRV